MILLPQGSLLRTNLMYGATKFLSSIVSSLNLFFFRDPNFEGTLSAFENSVQWALDGKFTDQDIEEAKLSVFAEVRVKFKNSLN